MTASTKSIADVLDAAADLIAAPGAWTQGDFAKRADGADFTHARAASDVSLENFGATCYCIYGAVAKVAGLDPEDCYAEPYRALRKVFPDAQWPCDVANWNDARGRTQAEVVAKLREAAAKARAELVA